MHPLAAEPDRVTDGRSAQSTRRDPVFAGATQSSQRRRGQTRPVQRQFGSGITFLGKRTGGAFGNETAHQAQQTRPGSDRPGRGAESRPDIASAGCGIQGLRRCGGAGVTLRHRQCEVSQGEVLRGLYRPNLPGAAAGWVPRRIRSQSEEPMLLFAHLCNMTEPKIADLLDNMGILISSGPISAWLTGAYPELQEEKRAIVEAGLNSSAWHHIDDTGTRVNGVNQHCQVICNPLYGAYFTTARKDRLTIIDVLRNGRERVFRFNEEALGLLRQFGVSQRVLERVGQLPFHQDWSQEELQRRLAEQIPDLVPGVQKRIVEAAALAAYHAESGHVRLLVCDDARQFKLVADPSTWICKR